MKLFNIKKVIKAGITLPYLVSLSDNNNYIMKFPGNPETERALICENICYELAKFLNLPLLVRALVDITLEDYKNNIDILDKRINHTPGKAFALLYNKFANPVNNYKLILKASNRNDFLKIYIFDILIGNYDRNKGNLLYDVKMNKIIIIDHTHVFDKGPIFRHIELNELIDKPFSYKRVNSSSKKLYEDLKNYGFFKDINNDVSFKEFLIKIKDIKENDILNIIKTTQFIWNFSDNDVLSLCKFLFNRFKRVEEIIRMLNLEVF